MIPLLSETLAQLNLQPGQSQRVQVNGYEVEIRRLPEEESQFANQVMLEPWVWFPDGKSMGTLPAHQGEPSLPDPPVLPPEEEPSA